MGAGRGSVQHVCRWSANSQWWSVGISPDGRLGSSGQFKNANAQSPLNLGFGPLIGCLGLFVHLHPQNLSSWVGVGGLTLALSDPEQTLAASLLDFFKMN